MFLPMTKEELKKYDWKELDVIIVTGDAYIDSYHSGISIIGNYLVANGFRVGIISQPDIHLEKDITRLGEPLLFWGVSAGCVDSIVANYTSLGKKRRSDDFTPGGENTKRPDRATIVYANLIRKYFKKTVPIVLGGIEASLRRITHYDMLDNDLRRPIIFDAKADIIIYGMGELASFELAKRLKEKKDFRDIKGICFIDKEKEKYLARGYIELPSYEDVKKDKIKFSEMFKIFYDNNDPFNGKGLIQKVQDRYLIHNPPSRLLSEEELDFIYELPYERDVHPSEKAKGEVKAIHTIKFSITTHRGCIGECNFCSISIHQGKQLQSRSENSILREAERIVRMSDFKGYIMDVGGPTANMYGISCKKMKYTGMCKGKNCLFPSVCKNLKMAHDLQIKLLKKLKEMKGVKKVFVSSGIRPDMVIEDKESGQKYLEKIASENVSGQLKLAPEHASKKVLDIMKKADISYTLMFKSIFDKISKKLGKKQFLTYYFIAAHPGCELNDMRYLKNFVKKELFLTPEQVQIFTPTPSTFSTLMYYTELNPFTLERIFVEKTLKGKEKQKKALIDKNNHNIQW